MNRIVFKVVTSHGGSHGWVHLTKDSHATTVYPNAKHGLTSTARPSLLGFGLAGVINALVLPCQRVVGHPTTHPMTSKATGNALMSIALSGATGRTSVWLAS